MAVLHPLDPGVGPVGGKCPLQVASSALDETCSVEARAVRVQGEDGRIGARVPHDVVGLDREAGSGGGVDHAEPIAWSVRAVQRRELTGHHDLRPVGRDGQGIDLATGGIRGPGEQGTVGGVHGREPRPGGRSDRGEGASQPDRTAHGGNGPDTGAHLRCKGADEAARHRIQGSDPQALDSVDCGEIPPNVEPGSVRRRGDRECLGVQHRSESRNEGAGSQIEGQDVAPGHLLCARGGVVGPCVVEFADHVDGVSDDRRFPGNAVVLGGGQAVGRDRYRCLRIVGVDGGRICDAAGSPRHGPRREDENREERSGGTACQP